MALMKDGNKIRYVVSVYCRTQRDIRAWSLYWENNNQAVTADRELAAYATCSMVTVGIIGWEIILERLE